MNDFIDNDDDVFIGKEHTPIREDAFLLSPDEKIEKIKFHFEEIMQLHLSNSATDEHAFVFLATDLTFEEAEPEDSEDLKIKKVHIRYLKILS